MTALARVGAIARKDLLLEWRSRTAMTAMLSFSVLVVLLLGFTIGSDARAAASILWVALGLGAMVGIPRLTRSEIEEDTLETLLLYPGGREAIYWGKWAALSILLFVLLALLLVLIGFLFNLDVWPHLPQLLGAGMLGIIGLASLGTLMAGLVLHVRGQELLMPLLLIPVALPVVLAGVRVTEAVMAGTAIGPWLGILLVFDAAFLLAAPVLFEFVMEET